MGNGKWWMAPAAAVVLVLAATSARAEVAKGTGEVELFLGYLFHDDQAGQSADDSIYGVRGGYVFTPRAGFQGSVGRYSKSFSGLLGGQKLEQTMLDFSVLWHVNPAARSVFNVYGGPGWTFADFGATSGDSLTLHVGLGAKIGVSDRFYVRPDARYRWYEESGADNEIEASVSVGW